jgi:hypothetical protein
MLQAFTKKAITLLAFFVIVVVSGCFKKSSQAKTNEAQSFRFLTEDIVKQGYYNSCWAIGIARLVEWEFERANHGRKIELNEEHLLAYELAESFSQFLKNPKGSISALASSIMELNKQGKLLSAFDGSVMAYQLGNGTLGGLAILEKYGIQPLQPGSRRRINKLTSDEVKAGSLAIQARLADAFRNIQMSDTLLKLAREGNDKELIEYLIKNVIEGDTKESTPLFPSVFRADARFDFGGSSYTPRTFLKDYLRFNAAAYQFEPVKTAHSPSPGSRDSVDRAIKTMRNIIDAGYQVPLGYQVAKDHIKPVPAGSREGQQAIIPMLDVKEDKLVTLSGAHVVFLKGYQLSPDGKTTLFEVVNSNNPDDRDEFGFLAYISEHYLRAVIRSAAGDHGFSYLRPISVKSELLEAGQAVGIIQEDNGYNLVENTVTYKPKAYFAVSCHRLATTATSMVGGLFGNGYLQTLRSTPPSAPTLLLQNAGAGKSERWLFFAVSKKFNPPSGAIVFRDQFEMELWKMGRLIMNEHYRSLPLPRGQCKAQRFEAGVNGGRILVHSVSSSPDIRNTMGMAACERMAMVTAFARSPGRAGECRKFGGEEDLPDDNECYPHASVIVDRSDARQNRVYQTWVPAFDNTGRLRMSNREPVLWAMSYDFGKNDSASIGISPYASTQRIADNCSAY